ncbi:MAG TPA: ABC transporter ATP-binding protein/permease [Hyphomonadaceae bacterium]|nr:ABC transporter ATP-binding protein/permease [Hyphomonadaceae bacterium]
MARHPGSTQSADVDGLETGDAGLGASLVRIGQIMARPQLKKWRPVMVVALLLTLASKVFAVYAPVFFGDAINRMTGPDAALSAIVLLLAWWTGARLLSSNLPYLRDALFAPVSQDAQRLIAVEAYGHAQGLSLAFHQTRRTGALNRIIDRGVAALDYLIRFLAFNIGPTLIELALAAFVLSTRYSWLSAVVAVIVVALYATFTALLTNWRTEQRRKLNAADTELRALAVDSLTNFETVKAFAAETRETDRYDAAMRVYNKNMVDVSRSLALLNAGQDIIMALGLTAVAGITAVATFNGQVQAGDMAAVVLIMSNLYRPLSVLGWAFREIKQGAIDLEKLYGLLNMKPEVSDAPGAKPLTVKGGEVRFEHVSFTHDARSAGIDDVSFTVPAGTKLAVVGPSGSGKSTLLKLLFRFYDTKGGSVFVDGQDVRVLKQETLRDAIGLVPQEVVLFNASMKENLLYGRPDASDEELRDAASRAQLLEFIDKLPKGWETRVGERGVKLSGGERQRVGIARAILKNPAILVLDEATSALDSATEQEVQEALDEAAKGRTTLMVAHRLSTVAGADEIIVLSEGKIVERGTHHELLAAGGLYADLWSRQSRAHDLAVAAAEAMRVA